MVTKATGLDERQLAGAIGWLAREDKIIFNAPHDGKLANLSLMLNLYIGKRLVNKKEAPGTAEGFFFHFSITADTTVILRLSPVSGGIFPARQFTVSSMLAMLR